MPMPTPSCRASVLPVWAPPIPCASAGEDVTTTSMSAAAKTTNTLFPAFFICNS
jgi:hypothetical protein